MKKKILCLFTAMLMLLSVNVAVHAAEEQYAITYTAPSDRIEGASVSSKPNTWFELGSITPGQYLITVKAAANTDNYPKFDVYIDDGTKNYAAASRKFKEIDVPTRGWTTFSDIVVGTFDFTAEHTHLCIAMHDYMYRLASVTLTPVPSGTKTYLYSELTDKIIVSPGSGTSSNASDAAWMYNGLTTGKAAWIPTDAPAGTYALMANVATNTEAATITAYRCSAFNANLVSIGHNVSAPYGKAWSQFTDVNIGFVEITDTDKMICLSVGGDMMRIKSITLIPVDGIRPDVNIIQNNVEVSAVASGDVTARINVNTATDNKTYAPIAAYYEDGNLISAIPAIQNTQRKGEWNVKFTGVTAGAKNSIKVFVWDGTDVCKPYMKAVEVPVSVVSE